MPSEFIHPNWHVIWIHYPLGLLPIGVILELVTIFWRKEGLRTTGRWLLLLGTFLSLPTALSGLYAFRDAVRPDLHRVFLAPWHEVVEHSPWTAAQWEFMEHHIWFNSSALVCFMIVVVTWIVSSGTWRHRLYWPLVGLMVLGAGLLATGAWHGGELVYRYGTAVESTGEPGAQLAPAPAPVPAAHAAEMPGQGTLAYFLPPLQLHIVLAGVYLLFVVAVLSIAARHWRVAEEPETETPEADRQRLAHRRWLWWLTGLTGLLVALAGAWSTMDAIDDDPFQRNWQMLTAPSHLRLSLHVLAGLTLVIVPLAFAVALHFRRERKLWTTLGVVVLLAALALQSWWGILMLYDGHEGPLFEFAPPAAAHAR